MRDLNHPVPYTPLKLHYISGPNHLEKSAMSVPFNYSYFTSTYINLNP